MKGDYREAHCEAFQASVELIGKRWTAAVVQVMIAGADRFSDIKSAIPGLSDRLLCERLTELENNGLLTRSGSEKSVRYELTAKGKDLVPVLQSISEWSHNWPVSTYDIIFVDELDSETAKAYAQAAQKGNIGPVPEINLK